MKRRDFLKFSAAVGSGFAVGGLYLSGCRHGGAKTANRPGKRPNIVFIMADDLGYGDLGCYGQQVTKTPRLDQMAAEGVRFTDCYAGGHMCAPSRAVLLTGKHQGHSSVREIWARKRTDPQASIDGRAKLRPDETTVAQTLKKAGYTTGAFGKRHAIQHGMSSHFGFDTFFHVHEEIRNYNWWYYPTSIVSEKGVTEIPANIDIAKMFEEAKASGRKIKESEMNQYWINGTYMDDIQTDAACEFIKDNAKDKPFFLYLAFMAPHTGYTSPSIEKYKDEDWTSLAKGYVAMVERMDSHVGRVLDAIKKAGIDENTIVFFTSDNGGICRQPNKEWIAFLEHIKPNGDLRKGKHFHYEGGLRVPMVVRWPRRIAPATVSSTPWYFADIFPTFTEIAGALGSVPKDVDGVSVLPTLLGRQQPALEDRPLYWAGYRWFGFHQVVRKGAFKLIRWTKQGPRPHPLGDTDPVLPDEQYPMLELYNLRTDHREQHNLAKKEPAKTKELLALLNSPQAISDEPRFPLTKEEQQVMESQ